MSGAPDQVAAGRVRDAEAILDASRVRALHVRVVVLCGLVLFMDGFNTQAIGYIMPEIARLWQVPHALTGLIFSSGLVGVLIGQLGIAPLSARFGPKPVIVLCTASFGALTMVTPYAGDATMLIVYRFLTGIGLGGAMPVAWSLVGEYAPRRWRSTFLVVATCGVTFGSMAAGFLAALMLSPFGWKSVLWTGGAFTLAVAAAVALLLPESPSFLIARRGGRGVAAILRRLGPDAPIEAGTIWRGHVAAQRSPLTQLFQTGRAPGTAAIWCAFFMLMMVYYFVQNWLTTVLVEAGHSQQAAITIASIIQVGGISSAFVVGPLMDRFNPYAILAAFFIAGGASVAFVGAVAALPMAVPMIAAFLEGFFILGLQKGMIALVVHFYPLALRPTGLGWGTSVGRLGAIIGPFAAGTLLAAHWPAAVLFYVAVVPMTLGAAALLVIRRLSTARQIACIARGVAPILHTRDFSPGHYRSIESRKSDESSH